MVLNRLGLALVLAAPLPCAAVSHSFQVPGPSPCLAAGGAAEGEFARLSALQKGGQGPLGWKAGIPARALFESVHGLAALGHGPALAWCARHLDQAPGELALDPAFGAGLFVSLVRDHGSQPWLLEARHDPLSSLERAPDDVRAAVESALALETPGDPLGLLLRAAALAPRDAVDAAHAALALELLGELSARAPLAGPGSLPEDAWRARAAALAWRIEHLAPGNCAPELALRDVDGNQLLLSDWLGKTVLVDVWSPDDQDLEARVEHRKTLLGRFRGQSFVLIGVGLERDESAFRRSLEELDLSWPTSYEGALEGLAVRAWHLDGGPTTVLIDRTGRVHAAGLEGARLERAIELLLASTLPAGCAGATSLPDRTEIGSSEPRR